MSRISILLPNLSNQIDFDSQLAVQIKLYRIVRSQEKPAVNSSIHEIYPSLMLAKSAARVLYTAAIKSSTWQVLCPGCIDVSVYRYPEHISWDFLPMYIMFSQSFCFWDNIPFNELAICSSNLTFRNACLFSRNLGSTPPGRAHNISTVLTEDLPT